MAVIPLISRLRGSHPKVSRVLLGKGIISPKVAFDLAEDRRLVTLQHTRHLSDRDFCGLQRSILCRSVIVSWVYTAPISIPLVR